MNDIQSAAAPVLDNATPNRGKDSEKKNASHSTSLSDMFQWLLASINTSTPLQQADASNDITDNGKTSETEQKADLDNAHSLNLSWLQQLLKGQSGGDNQSFLQIDIPSDFSNSDMAEVNNKIQSEHPLSQNAGTELQAITEQALAILQTLVNTSTEGTSSGDSNHQTASMSSDKQMQHIAAKLLQLLKQRGQIMQQSKAPFKGLEQDQKLAKQDYSTQETAIWKALSSAFDKRSQLTNKQHYNTEASISNQDVVKWIKQALRRTESMQYGDSSPIQKVSVNTGSMSKVEQYVIHVQQNNGNQAPDKTLLDQFQKAIQSSRLFGQKDHVSRVNFSLRPEGLGDMTVKLAKVEGEMTVKIMVSSMKAQDMMEKNIHQLKHMFSPNHVSIERQDNQFSQTQDIHSRQEDEQDQQQDGEDETDQSDEHDQQENDSDDFQEELDDLLNEKA